jgi:hypothetical protein
MSEEISWNRTAVEPQRGPHTDYPKNLAVAKRFCEKHTEQTLPKGMMAKITGSQHVPDSLLTISWKPPKEVYGGFYATPIFLHDSHREVTSKINSTFQSYVKRCADVEAKNPKEPTLFASGPHNAHQKV